jgi:hypothetical protein
MGDGFFFLDFPLARIVDQPALPGEGKDPNPRYTPGTPTPPFNSKRTVSAAALVSASVGVLLP